MAYILISRLHSFHLSQSGETQMGSGQLVSIYEQAADFLAVALYLVYIYYLLPFITYSISFFLSSVEF